MTDRIDVLQLVAEAAAERAELEAVVDLDEHQAADVDRDQPEQVLEAA